ncbi:MAG TPA: DUF6090 family protein [Cryomorphaceae bacterium]|nr:DUF6090 family protein [Cryomorphaceae bacterium]
MIKFFRHIRKAIVKENRAWNYLLYSIGEIVLVVVGILIALQINIANENRKSRNIEKTYLENIKSDLAQNLISLQLFASERVRSIQTTDSILTYFNTEKALDLVAFNRHCVNVMVWLPTVQHDNTYQELLNSGNLSIISNKEIKEYLQNIQTKFKKVAFTEGEMQQDFEQYLYDPFFETADLQTSLMSFDGEDVVLDSSQAMTLLNNQAFKNGFVLSSFNSQSLLEEYDDIIESIHTLDELIDNDLKN